MISKPMLASDWDASNVKFPVAMQPKIDGVRAMNFSGLLTGRSFKPHANEYVTNMFSHPVFRGFDGEMAAQASNHPRLCSLTTSALNTIDGAPWILWHVFDYVTEETKDLPYLERFELMIARVREVQRQEPDLGQHIVPINSYLVNDMDTLLRQHGNWRKEGYEGSIIRNPYGKFKQGRSTAREGGLLRIKDFADCEGRVVNVVEGRTNLNEAKLNAVGHTERSTHQENMVPNGQVGTIIVELLQDVVVNNGAKTIEAGALVNVAPGRMDHAQRALFWQAPDQLIGKIIKFQHFPKGVKDTLRFPTFQSLRAESDL